ncbi:nuclear transport factor 2 family protein [Rhodococcus sp. P1Y]|uniref:nuclear transport factor 2 family protein n=1 Tax=Rhodococcus sp. P1Y TaxID=1302308 RepID=UPI000EADD384|nr:nuclear transport factor 2 family protein [Rhodococcus sp. P1Y]AYJ51622.1 nuclear transport factor 2 family protein [Rhodococcus sp. P1Y]
MASTDGGHRHEHAAGSGAPLPAHATPFDNHSVEHGPESVVRSYYELVDANRVEDMLALFDDQAIYRRPGYEPLNGKSMLRSFYNGVRVIEHGSHQITCVIKQDRSAAVVGCFEGKLKSGSQVNVRFSDFFSLNEQGLITERDTFFFTPSI